MSLPCGDKQPDDGLWPFNLKIENSFYISNSADKTQMSGHKGLAKINEPP